MARKPKRATDPKGRTAAAPIARVPKFPGAHFLGRNGMGTISAISPESVRYPVTKSREAAEGAPRFGVGRNFRKVLQRSILTKTGGRRAIAQNRENSPPRDFGPISLIFRSDLSATGFAIRGAHLRSPPFLSPPPGKPTDFCRGARPGPRRTLSEAHKTAIPLRRASEFEFAVAPANRPAYRTNPGLAPFRTDTAHRKTPTPTPGARRGRRLHRHKTPTPLDAGNCAATAERGARRGRVGPVRRGAIPGRRGGR